MEDNRLDRVLAAGFLLDAALGAATWPPEPEVRRVLLKSRVKHALATDLAGLVTLDRFRGLLHTIDQCFPLYYPLVSRALDREAGFAAPEFGRPVVPPGARVLWEDRLEDWRASCPGLLPCRPHRKLTWPRLKEFLALTRGGWFGVKDFARQLDLDRKTAWEYLQKLKAAGLLAHNRGISAAARYCLAARFLTVRAEALREGVLRELADLPPAMAARLADTLIASGGEPFWEGNLPALLPSGRSGELLARLEGASLLEVVHRAEGWSLLRLPEKWRHPEAPRNCSSSAELLR